MSRIGGLSFAVTTVVLFACSGSNSGGSGPSTACKQKAGSDTDSDCTGQVGKPRKLDCSADADTDKAISLGCVRTKPGDKDVCCPTTITGITPSTSSGSGALECRQKDGSDTDSDCTSMAGKPRKLDCDSGTQTDAAIAAGCVRTKPGDSDVCCPLTISGTTSTSSSGGCTSGIDGNWKLSGSCGTTTCTVSLSGCTAQVTCETGASLSGTVNGSVASLTGSSPAAPSLTCTATFSGTTSFSLSCNACSGSGTKQ